MSFKKGDRLRILTWNELDHDAIPHWNKSFFDKYGGTVCVFLSQESRISYRARLHTGETARVATQSVTKAGINFNY